jgi:hypothetical protein
VGIAGGSIVAGQDLAQVGLHAALAPPLARVAERDLFEADAVDEAGRTDVEMAGDDDARREAPVPVAGPARAAPQREAWDAGQADQVAAWRVA